MMPQERQALHELAERFRWFAERPDFSSMESFQRKVNGAHNLVQEMGPMVAILLDHLAGVMGVDERDAAITKINDELDDDRAELP